MADISDPSLSVEEKRRIIAEHNATKKPHRFFQYDGFVEVEPGDGHGIPDRDGHSLCRGDTWELMSGGPNVRVLITPGTPRKEAISVLCKMVSWIARDDKAAEFDSPALAIAAVERRAEDTKRARRQQEDALFDHLKRGFDDYRMRHPGVDDAMLSLVTRRLNETGVPSF